MSIERQNRTEEMKLQFKQKYFEILLQSQHSDEKNFTEKVRFGEKETSVR